MYRSTCEFGSSSHKDIASATVTTLEKDCGSEGDSSKENSLADVEFPPSTPVSSKMIDSSEVCDSPWGRTLTQRSGPSPVTASPGRVSSGGSGSRPVMLSSNMKASVSPSRSPSNAPWNELSFVAEVLSPGFTDRVIRAAHSTSPRMRDGRRQYPTAQERYVRAGVMPNVRLAGRTKAVLTPRRTPSSPLMPLSRSPSAFPTSLSSDFLSSGTPRMPDIRSVASVLEPVSTSTECVRDPTSVQAVVAALQQAQTGKGVKRGACYMEAEDLSKRQRCSTPGTSSNSNMPTGSMPLNYTRDFIEDNQTTTSNGNINGGGGGEKRALDLSPSQGSPQQISPENKRRCVLDPMHASLSSSKYLDFSNLQGSGRDTPYSMYDSRRDSDSESNRSIESAQSKASERSLQHQTSEATGGDSCVVSPGPSEPDLSDRSGSHTPQSTRAESLNSAANGGTTNTSRTSTPRNATPPHHNHVITLEAYKADKTKSQQRLKKMLGMLFHVNENETKATKSESSSPVPSIGASSASEDRGISTNTVSTITTSSKASIDSGTLLPEAAGSKSEVTTSFTLSLKPSSLPTPEKSTTSESEVKPKDPPVSSPQEEGNVSVSAVIKLPTTTSGDAKQAAVSFSSSSNDNAPSLKLPVTTQAEATKGSSLVDFLKSATSPNSSSGSAFSAPSNTIEANPLLQSRLSMPSPSISVTPSKPSSEANLSIGGLGQISGNSSTGGFAFSTSGEGKTASSSIALAVSSAPNSSVSDSTNVSNPLTKLPSSPFTFGSNTAVKTPSTNTTAITGLATNTSSSTTGASSATFSFGTGPSVSLPSSSGFTTSTSLPKPTSTTSSNFTIPSMPSTTTTSQSNLFNFGSANTSTTTAANPPPSYPTQGDKNQANSSPSNMFNFGATGAQGFTATPISSLPSSKPAMPSFTTPLTSTVQATSGFSVGGTFAPTSSSSLTQSGASQTVAPSSTMPSTVFNFGPGTTTQAAPTTTTTSSGGFNFSSSTSQAPSGTALFQFGTSTAPSQEKPPAMNPLFPSSSQGNSATSSSPFTFGSSSNNPVASSTTATASPFTFGGPKTDNPPPPAYGTTATSAAKPAQSGFTFGSAASTAPSNAFGSTASTAPSNAFGSTASAAPGNAFGSTASAVPVNAFGSTASAAPGNAFGSAPQTTTSNTFNPTTNTSSAQSTGFNFGAAAAAAASPPSGFSFGGSVNKPAATTTASSSPFTFGGAAATTKPTGFGAPTTTTSASSPFNFGSGTTATPTFGSNPGQGFGAQTTSTPSFGTTTPSFGSVASPGATSPFGSGAASPFGATSRIPSFGSGSFGASATSGQSGTGTPSFGSQTASMTFGASGTTAPSFGAPNSGASPAPAFGSSSTATAAFGASSSGTPAAAPTFGAPSSGAAPAVPSFGSSSTAQAVGGFGATSPAAPSFGASFGGSSTTTGNSSATSPFQFGQGAANPQPPAFGLGAAAAAPGGAVFQFGNASPFNAGNPGAGAPRRPRNRASRRHR